jgi:uncharacterized phiE125 gp8 family phage protein
MTYPRGIFRDESASTHPVERWEFRYDVETAPTEEPVSLAEMKLFARIDIDDDDALISALISAARTTVEEQTGRTLASTTRNAWLDCVPSRYKYALSYRPIISVEHIMSIDEDGTEEEVDSGDIILDGANGIVAVDSTANPITSTRSFNAFNIQYIAGYGAAADVPEWAKLAVKMIAAHWYEHRESHQEESIKNVPYTAQLLIDQHKVVVV